MSESKDRAGSRPQKDPMAAAANTYPGQDALAAAGNAVRSAGVELETLFRRHQTLVMRSAYRITGSMTDAEDVLQTVFLRLAGRDFCIVRR